MVRCPVILDGVSFLEAQETFDDHLNGQIGCSENHKTAIDTTRFLCCALVVQSEIGADGNGVCDRRAFADAEALCSGQLSEQLEGGAGILNVTRLVPIPQFRAACVR